MNVQHRRDASSERTPSAQGSSLMNELMTPSPSLVSSAVGVISWPPLCVSSRHRWEQVVLHNVTHTLHRESWSRLLQECVNTKSAAHTSGSIFSLLQTHIHFLSLQLKSQHTVHMSFITYLAIWRAEIPEPNSFIQRSRNKSIIHWRHWQSNHSAIQKHTSETNQSEWSNTHPHSCVQTHNWTKQKAAWTKCNGTQAHHHSYFNFSCPVPRPHLTFLCALGNTECICCRAGRGIGLCLKHKQTTSFVIPPAQGYLKVITQTCSPEQ